MIYCAVTEIDVLAQLAFAAVRMLGASVHIWNFATPFLGVSVPISDWLIQNGNFRFNVRGVRR